MFYAATFRCYFSNHIGSTLMSNSAKCNFFFGYDSRYLDNVFFCSVLDHTQDSHFYWHGSSFNVPLSSFFFSISISRCFYLLILFYSLTDSFLSGGTAISINFFLFLLLLLLLLLLLVVVVVVVFQSLLVVPIGFTGYLRSSKFPQVSTTLLSILADLSHPVVCSVLISFLISNTISLFAKPLKNVSKVASSMDITITFVFHCFFSSLAWSKHLSIFLLFLFSLCCLLENQYLLKGETLMKITLGLLAGLDDPFVCKSTRNVMDHIFLDRL